MRDRDKLVLDLSAYGNNVSMITVEKIKDDWEQDNSHFDYDAVGMLLAEISRLTWDSLKWAETVGQHQAHIKQLVGEIKALTKERGEFIHTIAQLGKENQELRERLKYYQKVLLNPDMVDEAIKRACEVKE